MRTKWTLLIFFILILLITGCTRTEKEITAGFIYTSNINDDGIYALENAAQNQIVQEMAGKLLSMSRENVTSDKFESVVSDFYVEGANIIFISDPSYQDVVAQVAEQYPDLNFVLANGTVQLGNIKNYSYRSYEGEYLAGIAAGESTSSNLIGYVSSSPIPANFVDINAFALGVQRVNPEATIELLFVGDTPSRSTLNAAVSQTTSHGCDVITSNLKSNSVLIEAQSRGVNVVGNSVYGLNTESNFLTAITYNYPSLFSLFINDVLNQRFNNTPYVGTLANGFIGIDTSSFSIPQRTRQRIVEAENEIINGNLYIFTGPITNSNGEQVIAEGQVLTEIDLENMNYTISNVKLLNKD